MPVNAMPIEAITDVLIGCCAPSFVLSNLAFYYGLRWVKSRQGKGLEKKERKLKVEERFSTPCVIIMLLNFLLVMLIIGVFTFKLGLDVILVIAVVTALSLMVIEVLRPIKLKIRVIERVILYSQFAMLAVATDFAYCFYVYKLRTFSVAVKGVMVATISGAVVGASFALLHYSLSHAGV